jgi:hypothetical protein
MQRYSIKVICLPEGNKNLEVSGLPLPGEFGDSLLCEHPAVKLVSHMPVRISAFGL